MAKKSTEVSTVLAPEILAELKASFPIDSSFNRVLLPRLGMHSQDKFEGKGKAAKLVKEAGIFYVEKQGEEVDEDTGKKLWEKELLGTTIEGVILFQRKQLSYYDEASESYTSSPIYDTDDQILPLFKDKAEVDRGTPAELKSRKIYQGISKKGKPMSKLEDNSILYVLYDGEVHQLNLRGTSMFAWKAYNRTVQPVASAVITTFFSEAQESGSIAWNQMTFTKKRDITAEEAQVVVEKVREIKEGIAAEKAFYGQGATDSAHDAQVKKDFDAIGSKEDAWK